MSIIRDGIQSADLNAPVASPTLNLDFANSQELDPRITFTRGSVGTFVNKNGLIETAPANQPRFDYDPISGECRGLLIEEQRTNLVTNSTSATFNGLNNVTFSGWVKDYNNSDLGVYFVNGAYLTPFTNATYQTRLAKPKSASWTSGSVGTGWTRNYEKIVPYPNGWYRFIQSSRYTRQSNQNSLLFAFQIFNNRNTQTYSGDGTSGIYIWGPQVESAVSPAQAPFETSYIPTSGSTVTRSPDLARLQEPYFSPFFNKFEGSVVANYNVNAPVDTGSVYGLQRTMHVFYLGDKNDSTYNGYGVNVNRATALVHRLTGQAFVQTTNASTGSVYALNSPINNGKFCFTYDQNKLKVSCDAVNSITSLNRLGTYNQQQSITTQVFNEITIGWGNNSGFGTRYINGTIKSLQYYPKALNDAEMLYLTR